MHGPMAAGFFTQRLALKGTGGAIVLGPPDNGVAKLDTIVSSGGSQLAEMAR